MSRASLRGHAPTLPRLSAVAALVSVAAVAVVLALPSPALADFTQQSGCATDALDAKKALQRLDWARKCGLLTNSGGTGSWFASTRAFDAAGFPTTVVGAKEYREVNPNRAFSGNSQAYDINYYSAFYRYDGPPLFTVSLESSGATSGYYKWTASTPRAQPYYPSFNSVVNGGGVDLFPIPSVFGDCNLYQWDSVTGTATPWTGNYYVMAYCPSGAAGASGSPGLKEEDAVVGYDNRILLFRAVPEEVLPK